MKKLLPYKLDVLSIMMLALLMLVACAKDGEPNNDINQPTDNELTESQDAQYSLMLGVGSRSMMWTLDTETRGVTRAELPEKLQLRGVSRLYAFADPVEQAGIPPKPEGCEINNYMQRGQTQGETSNALWSKNLNVSYDNVGESSYTFYCREYNDVVTGKSAIYTPSHESRYMFFMYNVDNTYNTFTDAAGNSVDCRALLDAVKPANIPDYINNGTSLRWDNLPRLSPFCAWMHSDVVMSREPDTQIVKRQDGSYVDGNLIIVSNNGERGKVGFDVYVPFVMHPAMALLRLNYKLSYAYAMQSGGAAHDDVGFREFRIKSVVLNNFPAAGQSVSIPIKQAADKSYASLVSDANAGTFTEVATIYAAPTTSIPTVPMTITYDVCDRQGNLIRKDETVNASFSISQPLDAGRYYDINLSIVPSFLYVMSDIDPDSPTGYIVAK